MAVLGGEMKTFFWSICVVVCWDCPSGPCHFSLLWSLSVLGLGSCCACVWGPGGGGGGCGVSSWKWRLQSCLYSWDCFFQWLVHWARSGAISGWCWLALYCMGDTSGICGHPPCGVPGPSPSHIRRAPAVAHAFCCMSSVHSSSLPKWRVVPGDAFFSLFSSLCLLLLHFV